MIDGISISKYLNDEQVSYSCLEHINSSSYGDRYKLKTSSNAKYIGNIPVITISKNNKLTFTGSLPYLFNDNNLVPFSLEEVKHSFHALSARLNVDLSSAVVNNFEFGVAINIPFPFKEFIHHHVSLSKMDSSSYVNKGKYFQDKNRRIKLYDAGRNAKYKLSIPIRIHLQKTKNYNKNAHYAKLEIQYKKPNKYFKQVIMVKHLMDPSFLELCAKDLLNTYKQVTKTGFIIPNATKKLTTTRILAIALKEVEQITGIAIEQLIEKKLKSLDLLTNGKRYDRRISIKKVFADITMGIHNPYDITPLLEQAIKEFLEPVAY
jgi:hypothetical protein